MEFRVVQAGEDRGREGSVAARARARVYGERKRDGPIMGCAQARPATMPRANAEATRSLRIDPSHPLASRTKCGDDCMTINEGQSKEACESVFAATTTSGYPAARMAGVHPAAARQPFGMTACRRLC